MKYKFSCFFSRIALILLLSCQSQAATISYSSIADCKEKIENDNAAFSELHCKPVGSYQLDIKQQSPQYFTITLSSGNKTVSSELETITGELPMEPGKSIEWHLMDKQPKFMIFRLRAQTGENLMTEYLTVHLVTEKRICPLASIETAKNSNANQKARDLIVQTFSSVKDCPADVLRF